MESRLPELLNDFLFRDRRIADDPEARLSVLLLRQDLLHLVARSGEGAQRVPDLSCRTSDSLLGDALKKGLNIATMVLMPSPGDALHPVLSDRVRACMACTIQSPSGAIGVLCLDCRSDLRFTDRDVRRFKVFTALVGHELQQHGSRSAPPLPLGLGGILRSAREEMGATQEEIARAAGTSRIALSRWEAGAHSPSSGPLKRWAAALGVLAGGQSSIVQVVNVSSEFLAALARAPERLETLSPSQLENLVAERLDRMGYAVQLTGATNRRDGGIDIVAIPKHAGAASWLMAVQVKHHSTGRRSGRSDVDRLLAWQNSVFRLGMLVTNTGFTRDALWAAGQDPGRHFLRLRDFSDLARWLQGRFGADQDFREIPDRIEVAPGMFIDVPKPSFREAGLLWPHVTGPRGE